MYIVNFFNAAYNFLYKTFFYTFIIMSYTLKQIVLYITESTFYNYLQHNLGFPSEKQHTILK